MLNVEVFRVSAPHDYSPSYLFRVFSCFDIPLCRISSYPSSRLDVSRELLRGALALRAWRLFASWPEVPGICSCTSTSGIRQTVGVLHQVDARECLVLRFHRACTRIFQESHEDDLLMSQEKGSCTSTMGRTVWCTKRGTVRHEADQEEQKGHARISQT